MGGPNSRRVVRSVGKHVITALKPSNAILTQGPPHSPKKAKTDQNGTSDLIFRRLGLRSTVSIPSLSVFLPNKIGISQNVLEIRSISPCRAGDSTDKFYISQISWWFEAFRVCRACNSTDKSQEIAPRRSITPREITYTDQDRKKSSSRRLSLPRIYPQQAPL